MVLTPRDHMGAITTRGYGDMAIQVNAQIHGSPRMLAASQAAFAPLASGDHPLPRITAPMQPSDPPAASPPARFPSQTLTSW
jgi:hypothetical protein